MPTFDLLAILHGTVAVCWFVFSVTAAFNVRHLPSLRKLRRAPTGAPAQPSVTVVVAARNERERIEVGVRRLLAQRNVEIELVVVDDRSDDGTQQILERLADEDARLRLIRVEELPAEWLGKQHACHVGAQNARGEWILFTDADTWMNADLIADTVRAAQEQRADLVCLLPAQRQIDMLGRAAVLCFSMGLVIAAGRANRDCNRSPVGVGAFNLVRAALYRKCGGYERLRMEVIDDLKLGLLIQRLGGRLRCWTAEEEAEMDWAATPAALVRALEKNFFALAGLHYPVAIFLSALMFCGWGVAIVGPWSGHWTGLAAAAGLLSMALPAAMFARRSRWGLMAALLAPLIYPILPWTLLRSTWVTWRQGGIRWRGTLYPLAQLRRHRVGLF